MKKNSWMMLSLASAVAASFGLTGCAITHNKTASDGCGLLHNRGLIPPPYAAPAEVPTLTPVAPPAQPIEPIVPAPQDPNAQPALPTDGQPFVPAAIPVETPQEDKGTTALFPPEVEPANVDEAPKANEDSKAPAEAPATKAANLPPAEVKGQRTYTVVKGDNLSSIAYRYGIAWQDLAAINNLTATSTLFVGKKLVLPSSALEKPRAAQPRKNSSSGKSTNKSTGKAITAKPIPADGKYTVKSGDNLWSIARNYGIKLSDLQAWNPDASSKSLFIGQIIMLKENAASTAAIEPVAPAPVEEPVAIVPEITPTTDVPVVTEPAPIVEPIAPVEIPATPQVTETAEAVDVLAVPAIDTKDPAIQDLAHTVEPGDSLAQIALIYGSTADAIKAYNPTIKSDADLKVGMVVKVPFIGATPNR